MSLNCCREFVLFSGGLCSEVSLYIFSLVVDLFTYRFEENMCGQLWNGNRFYFCINISVTHTVEPMYWPDTPLILLFLARSHSAVCL